MESTTLIFTLIIAGIISGGVNFFLNYLDLSFFKSANPLANDDQLKPKSLWLALFGYFMVGIVGAFLTPLLNVLVGLKGYDPGKNFLIAFGYGLVLGYSTSRLLLSILGSILKRVSKIETMLMNIEKSIKTSYNQNYNVERAFLIPRPKWSDVFEGYPKTANGRDDLPAEDVFTSVLGSNYDHTVFQNACATRVSLGLLNANITLPKDFLVSVGKFRGQGFVASASKLQNYLSSNTYFGEADIIIENPSNLSVVQSKIGNRNGIYIILGVFSDASGHSTLWLKDANDAIGGHNYVKPTGTVYFWELK